MATKSENADIAVLQAEMKEVKATLQRIEIKLDGQGVNYVTQSAFDTYKTNIAEDLKGYKKSQNWQKLFLAIATFVIGALVTYFFATIGGKQ